MKLLTVSAARQDLGRWIKRAVRGQRICIAAGTHFVELRPVTMEPTSYAEEEYGLTAAQLDRAAARLHEETKQTLARGDYTEVRPATDLDALVAARRGKRRAGRSRRAA